MGFLTAPALLAKKGGDVSPFSALLGGAGLGIDALGGNPAGLIFGLPGAFLGDNLLGKLKGLL